MERPVIGPRTLTVAMLVAALELSLRHFGGYGQWVATEQSERAGWRMLPDQAAWSRDLAVPEQINASGFRDREWDPPARDEHGRWIRDERVFRVALVGQSMTYGTHVPIEQTWGRVLEAHLREDFAARGVERQPLVMNFAVQGYVFEQMARVYEDHIRPFRPDLLIVPNHPHDITPMKPAQDDADYDFRRPILRTAAFDWLNRHVINRWIPPPPPTPDARAALLSAQAVDDSITERPFARDNQEHWVAMAKRLDAVREQLAEDGGRLVLVTLPRWRSIFEPQLLGADTKWRPYAESRPPTVHTDPLPAFRPPMEALRAEILAKGLPATTTHDLSTLHWTDAQGVVRDGTQLERAGDSLFYLDDTGHYTAAGHALLGAEVFAALRAAKAVP
jgi:lysophospholipase L1-like esterase